MNNQYLAPIIIDHLRAGNNMKDKKDKFGNELVFSDGNEVEDHEFLDCRVIELEEALRTIIGIACSMEGTEAAELIEYAKVSLKGRLYVKGKEWK